ncbi:monomeric sarcosine oxidase-like [Pecten maximus]|uniref:monomeric sarcosine oxidase-like n=1 Tax=Pecten maximus TaxID=6579 RepID=UPI0014586690|nr:monomeric sarcosine oxidase-like [Pecten maximus]
MYDLCVIGAGLIGSAAARHASLQNNTRVCLIGPDEPQERSLESPREIFGAHYDEGRITRCSDPDPVWAALAQRSINRYRELERASGVVFYVETGCLMAGPAQGKFMSDTKRTVSSQNIPHEYLTPELLKTRLPYLNLPDTDEAIYETTRAGYINPRALINAQKRVAMDNKCDVIDDVVCKVSQEHVNGVSFMSVLTEGGRRIEANRVLLATGSFTTFRDLLRTGTEPEVTLCPLAVAKVEVSEEDVKHLERMPSILYYGHGAPDWPENYPRSPKNLIGIYVLPPIKYPDGKCYIKLGNFHDSVPQRLTTLAEVKAWFCGEGVSSLVTKSARLINAMTKGIKPLSYHGDQCVIMETPTNRPYIDLVHPGLGVAIGGNGYAAKSSDEIGRIAAMLVLKGEWDSDLPAESFKLRLKPKNKPQSKI